MVTQKYIKSRKVYQLTFAVPPSELPAPAVKSLVVAGTFNGWSHSAHPFKQTKSGLFKATVELDSPGLHHYRYLLNDKMWVNDWHAEAYERNDHGEDNCIINVKAV